MEPNRSPSSFQPIASAIQRPVQVAGKTVYIQHLNIDRPKVVAYLEGIPADKQELALTHALEVGVTELLSRRGRFPK
jgi:hypothetical protein